MNDINSKIRELFPDIAILKDQDNLSVFNGRNLPSFVKDFLIRKHLDLDGVLDKDSIVQFLGDYLPNDSKKIKSRLINDESVKMLCRMIVTTDIHAGKVRFSIPDIGIKANEAVITKHVLESHGDDLIDGEVWGVIHLKYAPPLSRVKGRIELIDYKPFKPYKVDLKYFTDCRKEFTTEEWIDVLISAMEYNASSFDNKEQKLMFLSRLLVFVEPRLNLIELAPKGTGKSYVYSNLSKYGWSVSGGKVTRAKLFYDKNKQQPGIFKNYDFVAFDEIQTMVFQDKPELQAILKAYLELGKATVDNYAFMSESGLMLMGNMPLNSKMQPVHEKYFDSLPDLFQDSALLDRFHGFNEGWIIPRLNKSMILRDWTINVEYFSEILHLLRVEPTYAQIVSEVVESGEKSDLRDLKAVQRIATAYLKLLFPHVKSKHEIDRDEFYEYCLEPATRKRKIIRKQCHLIDKEYPVTMPLIELKI